LVEYSPFRDITCAGSPAGFWKCLRHGRTTDAKISDQAPRRHASRHHPPLVASLSTSCLEYCIAVQPVAYASRLGRRGNLPGRSSTSLGRSGVELALILFPRMRTLVESFQVTARLVTAASSVLGRTSRLLQRVNRLDDSQRQSTPFHCEWLNQHVISRQQC
jgi:hypothetical protein